MVECHPKSVIPIGFLNVIRQQPFFRVVRAPKEVACHIRQFCIDNKPAQMTGTFVFDERLIQVNASLQLQTFSSI